MDKTYIANLIPDAMSRRAWIRAGMPTDLATVAAIVLDARKAVVRRAQTNLPLYPKKASSRLPASSHYLSSI